MNQILNLRPQSQAQVATLIEQFRNQGRLPGISAFVCVNDQSFYACSGFSNMQLGTHLREDALFDLGCVQKFFASVATVALAASGRLNLDLAVSSYLPQLRGTCADQFSVRH